ncbi:hypothetical protein EXIGLDRAFT_835860 [Exidia glandulosa HHB12029]|uniref:Conidiation-specific protein 13 n=1 Tax=Exidia glandulosa HHB12029 TaxID=1314781 RepID=A0A165ICP9_EXIGL|nr:hypothetical protein EXIGLDRAFT_835860 [Exidia glandulosa HHB12029]
MLSSVGILVAALAAAPAFADLGKSSLFPDGLHDPLIAFDTIKTPSSTNRPSSVPDVCKQYATGPAYGYDGDVQCDVANIEAREVFYEDCEQSWTICRCPDANMNLDQLEERFGQVPPGIRSYVGAILATSAGGCSAVTLDGTFVRYHGDCQMTVFLHESGHAFDSGFSSTQGWNDAISASSCVPDGYANTNPVEDWTQVNVLYTYTKQFGPLPADPSCLQPQLDQLANDQRINEAQDTKTCLPDKRPFTTPNDQAPPEPASTEAPAPPAPTSTEAPAPPLSTEAPAPPTSTEAPAPPPTSAPGSCNSAKFRFRNKVKRAYQIASNFIGKHTVTVPYSG